MLKLFTPPKQSTMVFDGDLKSKFDEFDRLFEKLSYIKLPPTQKAQKTDRSYWLLQRNIPHRGAEGREKFFAGYKKRH